MSSLEKIKNEHGSIVNFIQKAKEWISKIPKEYIETHAYINKFTSKSVDWEDPKTLIIINRCFTSIEHVEWINSVLRRIGKIESHLQKVKLKTRPRFGSTNNNNSTTRQNIDDFQGDFEKAKESALEFVQSVKEHVRQNLDVTERQLKALNNIHQRFDESNNSLLEKR